MWLSTRVRPILSHVQLYNVRSRQLQQIGPLESPRHADASRLLWACQGVVHGSTICSAVGLVTAPAFVRDILGRRKGVPNNADVDSVTSCAIAAEILSMLGVDRVTAEKEAPGTALEMAVAAYLGDALPAIHPAREWEVDHRKLITDFRQYEHLARLDDIVRRHPTLRSEIGLDYLIKPDVTVGIMIAGGPPPLLHAAISCKWTIRSDRVQNIRHEGVILTRSRRGRQPHIVTVTAEPLPTRLAAIARGTGEVDTVYHVALDELVLATETAGNAEQKSVLDELITQDRLNDFEALIAVLAI
jgi:hypothetical protein